MPRGDRSGPTGRGARTGRAGGFCAGFGAPGYANPAFGRGSRGGGRGRGSRGWGFGAGGYGWRHGFGGTGVAGETRSGWLASQYQDPDPATEKRTLENQAKALESELEHIKERLSSLGAKDETAVG
jgi:hypothetical protein